MIHFQMLIWHYEDDHTSFWPSCLVYRALLSLASSSFLLVFRVYYERPMVIDSLNLKLRQIAKFLLNVILDDISSAKCHPLFGIFFFDFSTRRKTTLPYTYGNFSLSLSVYSPSSEHRNFIFRTNIHVCLVSVVAHQILCQIAGSLVYFFEWTCCLYYWPFPH